MKIDIVRTKKSLDGMSGDKWDVTFNHTKQQRTTVELTGDELQMLMAQSHAKLIETYGTSGKY